MVFQCICLQKGGQPTRLSEMVNNLLQGNTSTPKMLCVYLLSLILSLVKLSKYLTKKLHESEIKGYSLI